MTDFEMLERIAQKACEPMDDAADPNKTIGQWRKEMGGLISEVVLHVSARRAPNQRA